MNKIFFSVLLLSVLGFIGYKYYYQRDSMSCHSCASHGSHDHGAESSLVTSLTTVQDLEAMLAHGKPALIKIYLDGCPPCKAAATVYPEIAQEFPNVFFYDLNVANTDVMNALIERHVVEAPITAAPTFLVIKDGKAIEILQGFNNKEGLVSRITPLFNN